MDYRALAEALGFKAKLRGANLGNDLTLAKLNDWNEQAPVRSAEYQSKMQLLPVETQAALMKNQGFIDQFPQEQALSSLKNRVGMMEGQDALSNYPSDKNLAREMARLQFERLKEKPTVQGTFNADLGGFVYAPTKQNPQGVFVPVQGAKKQTEDKPPTESQGAAGAYALRMLNSDKIMRQVGTSYSPNKVNLKNEYQSLPNLALGITNGLANSLLSDNEQSIDQAQRDFINANLRRESGATISPVEFESAKQQYFPQPNDSPALLLQKAKNRKLAIQGLVMGAGPLRKQLPSYEDSLGGPSLPQENDKGWTLYTDAQGNQAYVSPDGTQYEEVK